MPLPPRQPFQLPSTVTIVFREEKDGRVSAHALDFDLVSTDASREQAMKKIRLAITSYVETGLVNEWADDIRFPAPEEYWPEPGAQLEVGDPITILSHNLLVYSASSIANDSREANSLRLKQREIIVLLSASACWLSGRERDEDKDEDENIQ